MFEEFFAAELGFFDAFFFLKHLHHFGFGGNGSMVAAGHPAGVEAAHAGLADEDILHGFIEGMPHMQYAGNVGRRDHYGKCRAAIRFTVEILLCFPVLRPFVFCAKPGYNSYLIPYL